MIGLLEAKGQNSIGTDQDDLVLIPLRTFQRRIAGNQDMAMIQVSVQDGESTEEAQRDIERLLRERRRIAPNAGRQLQREGHEGDHQDADRHHPGADGACSARWPR